MVKTRQGWVQLSPLELLAVEAMGGAMLASAVGGAASAVGGVGWEAAAVVTVGASSVSVVLVLEMEAVTLAAMVLAVPEVVYPAVEDVTSSVGAPTVATWPMAAGTLWGR
eukprot:g11657.t1